MQVEEVGEFLVGEHQERSVKHAVRKFATSSRLPEVSTENNDLLGLLLAIAWRTAYGH
jgi:hypothetical protein